MRMKLLKTSGVLFIVCVIYILCIRFVDVQSIGPNGSKIGLSHLNLFFHEWIGVNRPWYNITKWLGVLPFLIVAFYAFIGLGQVVFKKSFAKVDIRLYVLGVFYLLVGLTYVLFEKLIINYRPVLMQGRLEASFPSSHTMLAITICMSSILMSGYYIKDEKKRDIFNLITWVLMIVLVVGRMISGVHWITDIIGAILISSFLLMLFYTFIYQPRKKKK